MCRHSHWETRRMLRPCKPPSASDHLVKVRIVRQRAHRSSSYAPFVKVHTVRQATHRSSKYAPLVKVRTVRQGTHRSSRYAPRAGAAVRNAVAVLSAALPLSTSVCVALLATPRMLRQRRAKVREVCQASSAMHANHARKGTQIASISRLLAVGAIVWEAGGDEPEPPRDCSTTVPRTRRL